MHLPQSEMPVFGEVAGGEGRSVKVLRRQADAGNADRMLAESHAERCV